MELREKLGRSPSVEELARAIEVFPQQLQTMLLMMQPPLSLDAPLGEADCPLIDLLAGEGISPDAYVEGIDVHDRLISFLEILPERQREVILWRFGLLGDEPMTFVEVGKRLGVRKQRIQQIEVAALGKLRKSSHEVAGLLAG
jgi:RNA polymerase sigma factor (sigma-70 family)